MREIEPEDITELLLAWRGGDEAAFERLAPLIYDQLRRLAHAYMRDEPSGHLLQTTALVHEAYIRLVGLDAEWEGRSHFFGVAAQLMRHVLVDDARRRRSAKRGSGIRPVPLEAIELADDQPSASLLALDDALRELEGIDTRKSRVLEMRFFGGLTGREIAEVLEVSDTTVERDMRFAKSWLAQRLGPSETGLAGPASSLPYG
ncbi:MAG: sigma-70 family RNA polymerase sigma factor [Deltaproteobacteria bacterium]|nr:sigma-70 family RNA polymerase sigma factor [Deltaproteobacteria bacterium]